MNKIYTLAFLLFTTFASILAQAPIPISNYTFDAPFPTLPSGWSSQLLIGAGTATTYATGNAIVTPGPACRLDATGEYVQVWLSGQPGNTKYYLKGNGGPNPAPFQGTFTVEESPDGITWTTLHVFVGANIDLQSFVQTTDVPLASTRYIRWFFTSKVSGYNIALDDIQIDAPLLQVPEINAAQGTSALLNNGYVTTSAPIGDSSLVTISIQNAGSGGGYLQCGVPVISGTNAANFTIVSHPDSIAPNSNQNLVIKFLPTLLGTHNANVSISNNDSDENPFLINLYGAGNGLSSEPLTQPINLVFNSVKSYRINASFTPSVIDPFGGYIVVRSNVALPANIAPTDGKTYQRGDTVATYKVVYSSTDVSFNSAEIYAGISYHFTVWAYNGQGTQRNYLQANPLTANITTPATMVAANLYNGISISSNTFIADLHALINPHTSFFYSNYAGTMINKFSARDTTLGRKVMTSVYSNKQVIYTLPFDFTATDFSREHTYAHSWMPTFPADVSGPNGTELPEYNDQHHLFPALLTNENMLRSNNPFGEVITATVTNGQCKLGTDASGAQVFEPANRQKGDCARALFYMCVCYTGVNGYTFNLPPNSIINENQNLSVLLKWHYQDPPDAFEIARNDYLDSLQGNRNPFVDNPGYACYINFKNMTYIANPTIPCDTFAVCSVPMLQSSSSLTNTSATISWNVVPGSISYTLKYKKTSDPNFISVPNVVSPYLLSNLDANNQYQFQVINKCAADSSTAIANPFTFTTTNVGINELTAQSIYIAPNPSKGLFTVNTNMKAGSNLTISVIDVTGRICFTETKNIVNSNFEVNTGGLKAGVYTLRINNKNGVANNKIVIE